jgi:small GTP-binding protein
VQNHSFKILVTGEGGVGKTTLLHQFVSGTFLVDTGMTIGVQFHLKTILVDGVAYSLHLWDLGGQERFRFMLPSYVMGAKGALLLYDTTRIVSLEKLEEWVNICRTHDKNLPILLCGTKVDLMEDRSVPVSLVKDYVDSLNLFGHLEVSAKTGQNVLKAFELLINKMIHVSRQNSPALCNGSAM